MAGATPRLPEQFQVEQRADDFHVSELVSDAAGAHSPFGDIEYPVPYQELPYRHPGPADRPYLAEGR